MPLPLYGRKKQSEASFIAFKNKPIWWVKPDLNFQDDACYVRRRMFRHLINDKLQNIEINMGLLALSIVLDAKVFALGNPCMHACILLIILYRKKLKRGEEEKLCFYSHSSDTKKLR